jgi:outer membrane protein assembly factor BamA
MQTNSEHLRKGRLLPLVVVVVGLSTAPVLVACGSVQEKDNVHDADTRQKAGQVHYKITMVIVRGNRWVPSSTVRKSISIHPGDVYDSAEIESDVAALKKTGYFDNVRAETKDDEWTKDGKMVTFHVREKKDLILPHAP